MKGPPKVLISTPFASPHVGGISTFVENLVNALQSARRWDCWVISRRGGNVERRTVGYTLARFLAVSIIHILQKKPSVVHANAAWYALFAPAVLKAIGFRFHLVFTFHTMPPSHRPIRFKFVLERLLGLCNVVTFVSAALETQVKEQIRLSAPTVVLYPGVPIPTTASSCSAATGAEVVGFAGPLVWKEKASGVGLLLEAMPPLKERFPRCELWVAGSGPHLPVLVDRAKVLGVGDCVRFLGNLPSLEPFWSSVWVYAHISLQEGLPLALLEAMSFAKPTVVTGIGGIPEVVVNERNGIIVRPEASAIADAIGRLFADKDAAMRLGAEGRKTIETRFSLDRMASAAADIYGVGP